MDPEIMESCREIHVTLTNTIIQLSKLSEQVNKCERLQGDAMYAFHDGLLPYDFEWTNVEKLIEGLRKVQSTLKI